MTAKEYNECVNLFADRVYRFVVKNMRNEADARDVVQNSYEILWRRHKEVSFSKARPYLFTVAFRNMLEVRKKVKPIVTTDQLPEIGHCSNIQPDFGSLIENALARLPEIQRTMVMLRDHEGYAYAEIAQITDHSESQVKVYIFRARKKLQQLLVSIDKVI